MSVVEKKSPADIVTYKEKSCNLRVSFHGTPQSILSGRFTQPSTPLKATIASQETKLKK